MQLYLSMYAWCVVVQLRNLPHNKFLWPFLATYDFVLYVRSWADNADVYWFWICYLFGVAAHLVSMPLEIVLSIVVVVIIIILIDQRHLFTWTGLYFGSALNSDVTQIWSQMIAKHTLHAFVVLAIAIILFLVNLSPSISISVSSSPFQSQITFNQNANECKPKTARNGFKPRRTMREKVMQTRKIIIK